MFLLPRIDSRSYTKSRALPIHFFLPSARPAAQRPFAILLMISEIRLKFRNDGIFQDFAARSLAR